MKMNTVENIAEIEKTSKSFSNTQSSNINWARKKKNTIRTLRILTIWILAVIILFPIYWIILTSVRPIRETMVTPPNFLPNPQTMTLRHYQTVLSGRIGSATNQHGLPTFFVNSVIISVSTAAVTIFASLLAAYSLVRIQFRGRRIISHLIMVCHLIPGIALLIPMFVMAVNMGVNNTRHGLILFQTAAALPLGIWFAKAFLKGLPIEVEESAKLDGCNQMQVILKIVAPLAVPGLIVVGFNTFLASWNDFILPSVLISQDRLSPLMVGLFLFFNENIGLVWGEMMAAAFVAMVPVFFGFFYFQKYIVSGISAGAVKG